MSDVPLDVNFFFIWVHLRLEDIVHPKPGFARWVCNDFKSESFRQITALQFKCLFYSLLAEDNLERVGHLSGPKFHLITPIFSKFHLKTPIFPRFLHTLLPVHVNLEREVRSIFPPPDPLRPCLGS